MVTNTNAVYHLFNPVPRTNLQRMESDLLVATPSPRTVEAGHSILQVESGIAFMNSETNYDSWTISSSVSELSSTNQKGQLSQIDTGVSFLYRLGLTKRIELGLSGDLNHNRTTLNPQSSPPRYSDFQESPGWQNRSPGYTRDSWSLLLLAGLKWALNPNQEEPFQLSFLPSVGFNTFKGLHAVLGVPIELRFHEKFRIGFMPQIVTGFGIFTPPISRPASASSNFGPAYNLEIPHSTIVRYLPESYINFFLEYFGRLVTAPNVTSLPPSVYTAMINLGTEFTFWKNLQLAIAGTFGLVNPLGQFGLKTGIAFRF